MGFPHGSAGLGLGPSALLGALFPLLKGKPWDHRMVWEGPDVSCSSALGIFTLRRSTAPSELPFLPSQVTNQ